MSETPSNFRWKFFRAGGFDQVLIDSGAALKNLSALDPKLWAALACPTTNLEFDAKTLAMIDSDKDGRIRVPELLAATKWACDNVKNPDMLLAGAATLPLNTINDATPEGKQLLSSAKQILVNLGKGDATVISIDDTADTVKIFAQTQFNGDGIIPIDSTDDAVAKKVIEDIIACYGPETDRSGKPGINQAKTDLFFTDATAYSDWNKKSEGDAAILPLGEATAKAAAAVKAVKVKIDDYMTRCRLAAYDTRSTNALNRDEKDYLLIGSKDLTLSSGDIANLPLALVAPNKPLPLTQGLNPAWAAAIATFNAGSSQAAAGRKNGTQRRRLECDFGRSEGLRNLVGWKSGCRSREVGPATRS